MSWVVSAGLAAIAPLSLAYADTTVTVDDAEVIVTGPGTFPLPFVVSRSGDSEDGVRLVLETAPGGDNPAVPGDDYEPLPPGTEVLLGPGETSTTVTVDVFGDPAPGPDKTLLLQLTGAQAFSDEPRLDPTAWNLTICGGADCLTRAMAVADLNDDGHPDIVAGNDLSRSISILLSDGEGGFGDAVDIPITNLGEFPVVKVAIGDVDGDGFPDIVVAGFNTSEVRVFTGDGTGSYGDFFSVPLGSPDNPSGVVLADVNGDGHLDIVASIGFQSSEVAVLINDGSGGFASSQSFPAGASPTALTVADVNGDGHPDIVVANFDSQDISVLAGDGTGGFAAPQTLSLSPDTTPFDVIVADINGDDHPDIVTANRMGLIGETDRPGSVSIFEGDGSGGFAAELRLDLDRGFGRAESVAVADLTGNGYPDIVVSRPVDSSVSILVNEGTSGFLPLVRVPTNAGTSPVAIADVTGDGILDIVAGNSDSNVSILPGDGIGGAGLAGNFSTGRSPHSTVAADLNGDGYPDVVTANLSGNDVSVLLGDGTGEFAESDDFEVGSFPSWIAVGDIDGDDIPDLVTANMGSSDVSFLAGDGTGGFADAVHIHAGSVYAPYAVALGDVNGDGHLDIVTANATVQGDDISVLLNDGTGGFAQPELFDVGAGAHDPRSIVLADVTGDGHLDIVTANAFSHSLSLLVGDGSGGFADAIHLTADFGPITAVTVADVTGDGHPDLIALNHQAQTVSVLAGDGDGGFGDAIHFLLFDFSGAECGSFDGDACPWAWDVAAADVTGDGHLDIVTANTNGNTVSVLVNDGTGDFSSFGLFPTGKNPKSLAVVDVDGDGQLDVVTANQGNDSISVLRNTLGQVGILDGEAVGTIITEVTPGPALAFEPDILAFGDVEVGTTSPPQTAVLRNVGTEDIVELSFVPLSEFAADTSDCGDSLAVGEDCSISVTFSPTDTGYVSRSLSANSANAFAHLSLNGTGIVAGGEPQIEVDPMSLSIVLAPGESGTLVMAIGNIGEGQLDWEVVESGTFCSMLTWASLDPSSGTVPAGDSQEVEVIFDATGLGVGNHQANLCLGSNDPEQSVVAVALDLTVKEDSGESEADIGVTVQVSSEHVQPGQLVDYLVVISNAGPDVADAVSVVSELAPELDLDLAIWQCVGPLNTGCTESGTGNLFDQDVQIPVDGSVLYAISAPVRDDADGALQTHIHVEQAGDPNPGNDSATATSEVVLFRDGFESGDGGAGALLEPAAETLVAGVVLALAWPEPGESLIDKVLVVAPVDARSPAEGVLRLERLNAGSTSWARLVAEAEGEGDHVGSWLPAGPGAVVPDIVLVGDEETEVEHPHVAVLRVQGGETVLPLRTRSSTYRFWTTVSAAAIVADGSAQ